MSDKSNPVPLTQNEDFIAEHHAGEMDMSSLYDKQFIVAVSTGDRNKCKHLASTICGPFDFVTMVEVVGKMYRDNQHHAKATILQPEYGIIAKFLDAGTTDYIEAHWEDIVFEATFEAAISQDKILKPGIIGDNELNNTREEE